MQVKFVLDQLNLSQTNPCNHGNEKLKILTEICYNSASIRHPQFLEQTEGKQNLSQINSCYYGNENLNILS